MPAKFKNGLKMLKSFATQREGTLLSESYTGMASYYKWRCKNGHTWATQASRVQMGQWCNECYKSNVYLSIEILKAFAARRGGECLSSDYTNSKCKYLWKCDKGHIWEAQYHNLKNGRWCPECSTSRSERLCREVFRQLFSKEFPRAKPEWLINPATGRKLELDGYNEELHLAFEYNGAQHYRTTNFGKKLINSQKIRDNLKSRLCVEHSVALIVIPTLNFMLPAKDLVVFIQEECAKLKIAPSFKGSIELLDLSKAYISDESYSEKLSKYISIKKGKIISEDPLTLRVTVECSEGHQWSTRQYALLANNSWCGECLGRKPKDLKWAQNLAKAKNGICLSTEYKNVKSPMRWRCKERHEWTTRASAIQQGQWCKKCSIINNALKRKGKKCTRTNR